MLLADSQEIYRRGLQAVLEAEEGIEVVGQAAHARQALEAARELKPDVVLVDVRLPGGGLEALRWITSVLPDARVLMLTPDEREADFYEAARAGARGYLVKDTAGAELAAAVRAAAVWDTPVSPAMASRLMREFSDLSRRLDTQMRPRVQPLSGRELEVLRLVARGLTNRQVAAELYISENTVKNHVRNILDKLQMRSRVLAVIFAVQEGLIEPEVLPQGPGALTP